MTNPTNQEKQIAPIGAAATAERLYARRLRVAVEAMAKSVEYWAAAKYRAALDANQEADVVPDPERATDAKNPALERRRLFLQLADLRKRWDKHFSSMARKLAVEVVNAAYQANKAAWQGRARKEGFDVTMQLTAAQRAILDVKVADNVALIKSIPAQYFDKIEGDVSRGFLAGRDLDAIVTGLRKTGRTTVRRASLIASDQANKLSAAMGSARQKELGVRWAYWKHSTVDKDPRIGHLRASREKWVYDTQVGIDFGDQFGYVLPGVAIACRCGSRSIIPAIDGELRPEDLTPVAGFPGAYKRKG